MIFSLTNLLRNRNHNQPSQLTITPTYTRVDLGPADDKRVREIQEANDEARHLAGLDHESGILSDIVPLPPREWRTPTLESELPVDELPVETIFRQ